MRPRGWPRSRRVGSAVPCRAVRRLPKRRRPRCRSGRTTIRHGRRACARFASAYPTSPRFRRASGPRTWPGARDTRPATISVTRAIAASTACARRSCAMSARRGTCRRVPSRSSCCLRRAPPSTSSRGSASRLATTHGSKTRATTASARCCKRTARASCRWRSMPKVWHRRRCERGRHRRDAGVAAVHRRAAQRAASGHRRGAWRRGRARRARNLRGAAQVRQSPRKRTARSPLRYIARRSRRRAQHQTGAITYVDSRGVRSS